MLEWEITKMGRSWRWLKGFLGMKEEHANGDWFSNNNSEDGFEVASFSPYEDHRKEKKRWSFRSRSSKVPAAGMSSADCARPSRLEKESTEGRLAEAAAKAADAAVMAARAAVVIVRLTADSGSRRGALSRGGGKSWAALKIQTVFRGFLARKALKALKGIVKLQALIRGYMTRKETWAAVRTMQSLARARAASRSQWPRHSLDKENGFEPGYWPRHSIDRFEERRSSFHSKRYSSWDRSTGEISDDASLKTDGIEGAKPHLRLSKLNRKDVRDFDAYRPSTARCSRMFRSYTGRCEPVIPARSLCGECTALEKRVCPEYPNYMVSTRSFEAKLRTTSAPKQRPIAEWLRHRRITHEESWRRGTS